MLDHPFAAIGIVIFELIVGVVVVLVFAGLISFVVFSLVGEAVVEAFDYHTNLIIDVLFACLSLALLLVVLIALALIVPAVLPTLRE